MPTSTRLMATTAQALVRMRAVLSRMDRAPEHSGEPYFLPYIEAFGRLAKERGLSEAGIRRGEEFALLWDQRSRDFIDRQVAALEFSWEEQERMLLMLSEFGDWLKKSFPETDEN